MEPWINKEELDKRMKEWNYDFYCFGPRENKTDGEADLIYSSPATSKLFRLKGNYFDRSSFKEYLGSLY